MGTSGDVHEIAPRAGLAARQMHLQDAKLRRFAENAQPGRGIELVRSCIERKRVRAIRAAERTPWLFPNLGQTTAVPELAGVSLPSVTGNTKGVIGGGQVGCNNQVAPNWVIGIEGDGEAADIKGDVTQSVSFTDPRTGGPNTVTGTAHAQTDWIASVTGRLGWTWDRVMVYAKGGAAWAGDKYSADLPAFNEHIATSVTRPGWTVGGGIEWAFWQSWSAKVEYDYYDFSTRSLALPGTIFGIPEIVPGINVKETISTVKFGINYRFGPY
jgi:outer membrane immunogenic protein